MFSRKPKDFAEARQLVLKTLGLQDGVTDDEVFASLKKAIDRRDKKVLKALEGKLGMIIKHFQEKNL